MDAAKWAVIASSLLAVGSWSGDTFAAENYQTHANLGFLDFLGGFEPPPGLYFRNDGIYFTSNSLNDRNGNPVRLHTPIGAFPVKFQTDVVADIATFYYVSPLKILGGNFATAVLVPFANKEVTLSNPLTGTAHSNVSGLGDVIIAPQLGWHLPQWNLHLTIGPAFYVPTGEYNVNDQVNNDIGHNFLTVEPQVNITYLNAGGQEVSAALAYDFNFRNPATNYTGGQEFSVNYAIAQHFKDGWTLGVAGFYYIQVAEDTRNGNVVFGVADQLAGHPDLFNNGPGNRGEVFSIGPAVSYNYHDKVHFEFKWEHEVFAVNRVRGEQFWWRVSLPLGLAGSASVTAIPAKTMPVKAARPTTAPALSTWTGFYVGVTAGAIWDRDRTRFSTADPVLARLFTPGVLPTSLSIKDAGFIGGGQIGFNYQTGAFVWGVEADFSGTNLKDSPFNSGFFLGPTSFLNTATSDKLDALGTVRGRLGYTLAPPVLLYGTGGLAFGDASASLLIITAPPLCGPTASTNPCAADSFHQWMSGWTVGGGFEYGFGGSWSVKAEYLHYDLGGVSRATPFVSGLFQVPRFLNWNTKAEGDLVRAGINYRFNWDPVVGGS